jgi:hypothetical protein
MSDLSIESAAKINLAADHITSHIMFYSIVDSSIVGNINVNKINNKTTPYYKYFILYAEMSELPATMPPLEDYVDSDADESTTTTIVISKEEANNMLAYEDEEKMDNDVSSVAPPFRPPPPHRRHHQRLRLSLRICCHRSTRFPVPPPLPVLLPVMIPVCPLRERGPDPVPARPATDPAPLPAPATSTTHRRPNSTSGQHGAALGLYGLWAPMTKKLRVSDPFKLMTKSLPTMQYTAITTRQTKHQHFLQFAQLSLLHLHRGGSHGPSQGGVQGRPKRVNACGLHSLRSEFPGFPPGGGGGECMKIIRIEDAALQELATALLEATRGFIVPVGTMVVLSSASHLAWVGATAYARECCNKAVLARHLQGRH